MKQFYVVVARILARTVAGLLLVGCATAATPEPTLSPQEIATRLAKIPTAASNPTVLLLRATATPTPIPLPVAADLAATATTLPSAELPRATVSDITRPSNYVVRAGDTLSSIAFAFNVSMASIQIINDMGGSQIVQLGQTIKIPSGKQFPDENVYWFVTVIDSGDTLTGLSSRYSVSVDDLIRVNRLDNTATIRIGQTLIVPVSAPRAPPNTGGPISEPQVEAQAEAKAEPAAPQPEAPTVIELQPIIEQAQPVAAPTEAPLARSVMQANSGASESSGDIAGMRQTLHALYNQVRAEGGLAPLSGSGILQNAAQWHAEDCALRGYGSHVGTDGAGTRARMQRAGYTGNITGENWAWARTAEQAFNMWFYQESPSGPHRANIMSSRYTDVGFGIVPSNGGYYFIADLGTP